MRRLSFFLIATLPCCLCTAAQAASVYRCSDADGNVSFNQHGCPPGSQAERQQMRTPNLLNSEPITGEISRQPIPIQQWDTSERTAEIVVIGEREEVCGNLISPQERRQAIIRKQIRSGMTRADVESALGKPDRISSNNGQVRYHYERQKGVRHQVAFDDEGCVKSRR